MPESETPERLAAAVVAELVAAGKSVTVAESCTGGWIAKALTDISGSSACFGYGIVSYSNGAKESLLGVSAASLQAFGAVSEAVVREMAEGALHLSGADFAVAVSGIAGPTGGTAEKPVGTVWIAWSVRKSGKAATEARKFLLEGDRGAVRSRAVILALQGIRERIGTHG